MSVTSFRGDSSASSALIRCIGSNVAYHVGPAVVATIGPDVKNTVGRPRLEVYVSSHCGGCGEAVRLAREAAARFPGMDVRLVDLDDGGPIPDDVVAVPTYVMDGRVVWLGNPAPEELFARLHEAVA